jgi:putative NADPH-quinone reductase
MDVSLVLAHPKQDSLNHGIADAVADELRSLSHRVAFHDLYAEGFDPVLLEGETQGEPTLDPLVELHRGEVAMAEGMVLVHPNWWGQPPAILKGWVDRVLVPRVAYEFSPDDPAGAGAPSGLLRAGWAVVLNTTDTPRERELREFGDPLAGLWRDCILRYCGVKRFERRAFGVVATSTARERAAWLEEARSAVRLCLP